MANNTSSSSAAWGPVKRFFQLLQLDKKDITYIYIYSLFSGLITLSLPLGVQAIIGLIAGGTVSYSLILLVLVVTVGTALTGILKVMQLTVTESLQRRIFTRSSFEFAYRIPRLRLESMINDYPPELVNRFFDTLTLQKGVPKILMDFSSAILQIVFGLILVSFYHPFFVFFGLILMIILIAIFWITGPAGLKTSLKESKYKYEVAHWLEELARAMTTFKLAGRSNLPIQKTDKLVTNYLDNRKKHFRILLIQYGNIVGFKTVVTGALLLLGSILVVDNQINIGQFVAAEIVIILIMASVEKLIVSMDNIYDVLTATEKIGNVTDVDLDGNEGLDFEKVDTLQGMEVNLRNLSFQFNDAGRPTVDKLNLRIQPGEKLCIVGYNGAGKSTLIQLIAGLYTSFTGSITYNGIPLKNYDLESLRSFIGDHSSQEDLFKGTLIENICLGYDNVSFSEVVKTVEVVGLTDYIQQLPYGYDSPILSEGKNIPGNIRTKIILARSIVSKPRLLAIEEPFKHLHFEDKKQVTDLLTSSDNPWTLVVVSDDPYLASKCDRIIVMKGGTIVEEGNYQSIANCRHFNHVFRLDPMFLNQEKF